MLQDVYSLLLLSVPFMLYNVSVYWCVSLSASTWMGVSVKTFQSGRSWALLQSILWPPFFCYAYLHPTVNCLFYMLIWLESSVLPICVIFGMPVHVATNNMNYCNFGLSNMSNFYSLPWICCTFGLYNSSFLKSFYGMNRYISWSAGLWG